MGCKEENTGVGIRGPWSVVRGPERYRVLRRRTEGFLIPDPGSLIPDPDYYPPAMAPTTRKGSAPATTASGNAVSGGSWE